jgi:hypothetical protein
MAQKAALISPETEYTHTMESTDVARLHLFSRLNVSAHQLCQRSGFLATRRLAISLNTHLNMLIDLCLRSFDIHSMRMHILGQRNNLALFLADKSI